MNQETKICQNCRNSFVIEPEDFVFYQKIDVPPPTWCPECRFARRITWRNEHNLYKKKCEHSGKDVFSTFHKDSPVKIYELEYWNSDNWDPMEYGIDYDFSRPFFEQFNKLMLSVPLPSRTVINLENSDYCANAGQLKNCYLIFNANGCENTMYSIGVVGCKDSIDLLRSQKCELSYYCFACGGCYRSFYSIDCGNCQDIYGCKECSNCSNCILCVGLKNKNYCILNKQYTKEEYFSELEKLHLDTYDGVENLNKELYKIKNLFPVKYALENHNSNVSGDYISYSDNVKNSYVIINGENLRYCQFVETPPGAKDSYDYSTWGQNAERIYECSQVGNNISDIKFSSGIYPSCVDVSYSYFCGSSSHLFGCIGLRKKEFCILNKQYTKESFEELRAKIIKHMKDTPYKDKRGIEYKYGEFFPQQLCPNAYNETVAQEFVPVSKERAIEMGFVWREFGDRAHTPTVMWNNIPENINDVQDKIVDEIISCKNWDCNMEDAKQNGCMKVFRITPQELSFYRKLNIPIPRYCFICRHLDRKKLMNPMMKSWKRVCQCAGEKSENGVYQNMSKHQHGEERCHNEFETSYSPERPEIVYCESCYQNEVV